jgi:thioredoxin-like negative regulator of GroEL
MSEEIQIIASDEEFDKQVMQRPGAVLVDFFEGWCHHCRLFETKFAQMAAKYGRHAGFFTVDSEVLTALGERFQIRKIPTVVLFEGGKETCRWVNQQDPQDYEERLKGLGK